MTERPRTPANRLPGRSKAGQAAQADREARLAEALRDNLRKRKAQSRGRECGGAAPGPGSPEDGEAGGEA